jgi:hypothetical protein
MFFWISSKYIYDVSDGSQHPPVLYPSFLFVLAFITLMISVIVCEQIIETFVTRAYLKFMMKRKVHSTFCYSQNVITG